MKKIASGRDISSLFAPPFGGFLWVDGTRLLHDGREILHVPKHTVLRYAALGKAVYFPFCGSLWEYTGDFDPVPTPIECDGLVASTGGRLFWSNRKQVCYSALGHVGPCAEGTFTINGHVLFLVSDGGMGVYASAGKRTFYAPAYTPQDVDVIHPGGVTDERVFWFPAKEIGLEGKRRVPVWRTAHHSFVAGLPGGILSDVSQYFLDAAVTGSGSASDEVDVVVRRNGKIIPP